MKNETNFQIEKDYMGQTFRGINKLAEILHCSYRTAHKIKESGNIPYSQPSERVFIFRFSDVLKYSNTFNK